MAPIKTRPFEEVVDTAAGEALNKGYPLEIVNEAKDLCKLFVRDDVNRRSLFFSMLYRALIMRGERLSQYAIRRDFHVSELSIRRFNTILSEKAGGIL
jgi:hypothetical protein